MITELLQRSGLTTDAVRTLTASMLPPVIPTPPPKTLRPRAQNPAERRERKREYMVKSHEKRRLRRISTTRPERTIDDPKIVGICCRVAKQRDVPLSAILSRMRIRRVAEARWHIFTLLRTELGMTQNAIARLFGLHHGSVLHGLNQHQLLAAARRPSAQKPQTQSPPMSDYFGLSWSLK